MKSPIYINDYALLSPSDFLVQPNSLSNTNIIKSDLGLVAPLSSDINNAINQLRASHKTYVSLDKSVLMAMYAARKLDVKSRHTAINIGSSRGATGLWEQHYDYFYKQGYTQSHSSPHTTLGNISSRVAQDLNIGVAAFSHSMTCSTASHAVLNAIAWLQSGMVDQFIAGGAEAPLTRFTISQMKAMRIYATKASTYSCQALDLDKTSNSMVLGEAAALLLLSTTNYTNDDIKIIGFGTAVESINSATAVSKNGVGLQQSMKMALKEYPTHTVDAIVTHAPGTIKGDLAEYKAILEVFGENHPALCNNKWQLGHSLGASAAVSMVMAVNMLKQNRIYHIPYLNSSFTNPKNVETPQRILVNSTGFGGNSVSILLEK